MFEHAHSERIPSAMVDASRSVGHGWSAPRPRIIIADDHRLVVAGLERLLEPYCDVVATAGDEHRLTAATQLLLPDIVLFDIAMSLRDGLGLLMELSRISRSVRTVVLTTNDDPDVAAEAIRSGASAYLLKNCPASELIGAIRHALNGEPYVTPVVAGRVIDFLMKAEPHRDRAGALTMRQRHVLQLLAEGKSAKEVADFLNVTVRTVAFHKYRMMKQLKITSSAELIRFAVSRHLV